jgi:predicted RNase H-like HicB family nuclease
MGLSTEHFPIIIKWDKEREVYEVTALEHPKYNVYGKTIEEAFGMLQRVLEIVVEAEQRIKALPSEWDTQPGIE